MRIQETARGWARLGATSISSTSPGYGPKQPQRESLPVYPSLGLGPRVVYTCVGIFVADIHARVCFRA